MGNKSGYLRIKKIRIPAVFQSISLKRIYSDSEIVFSNYNKMIWQGTLHPTFFCNQYLVEVRYILGQRPNVFVLKPELIQTREIPHVFEDGSLCLFRYKYYQWDSSLLISDTIIPWTCLWLYYYEQWLVTGKWYGGGEHPNGKNG